jgi:hypothetical protein
LRFGMQGMMQVIKHQQVRAVGCPR